MSKVCRVDGWSKSCLKDVLPKKFLRELCESGTPGGFGPLEGWQPKTMSYAKFLQKYGEEFTEQNGRRRKDGVSRCDSYDAYNTLTTDRWSYCGDVVPQVNWREKKDEPGFVYFHRTIEGWYKAGRAKNWDRHKKIQKEGKIRYRKDQYVGPARPARVFFASPARRMKYVESVLLKFLKNVNRIPNGRKKKNAVAFVCPKTAARYNLSSGWEWFLKERTAAARRHRKRQLRSAGPTDSASSQSASTTASGPPSGTT